MSNSRRVPYFFNSVSKQSSWEPPAGLLEKEISALPGAKEYLESARPGQVRASHLLVKHRDSRRASSWKEANITRTKEEAIAILREYEREINGDARTFGALAAQHSDCNSARNKGDLNWFERGQMQKPFEDAAFALDVGQISDVVDTDSGVHLILRTG